MLLLPKGVTGGMALWGIEETVCRLGRTEQACWVAVLVGID